MHSSSRRSSCFIADDDDSSISSSTSSIISFPSPHHRSYNTISSLRSFNGRLYYEPRHDNRHSHFLNTCAFCKKSIGDHMDIFMYRGDMPFCSEECRQEQIDMDEASEKKLKVSSGMKTTSSGGNNKYSIRTSTVAAV